MLLSTGQGEVVMCQLERSVKTSKTVIRLRLTFKFDMIKHCLKVFINSIFLTVVHDVDIKSDIGQPHRIALSEAIGRFILA